MGKLFNLLLILAGVAAVVYVINYFSPVNIFSYLTGSPVIQEGTCSHLVNINDESLEPVFKKGATAVFNKCFEEKRDDLKVGTVVLVEDFLRRRLVIVREKVDFQENIYYKVSTQENPSEFENVNPEEIKAIYEP